ncbi:MAG: acyl-CoA-binding protein [Cyclobacteriaceae bacterium]|nr:acyl-CoA-binding protein [Cyclobacteriaceae bacterium]
MDLEKAFESAVIKSKELTQRPSNDELLKLYALYKQSTFGDNTSNRPEGFDFKGAAKHDAWGGLKGMSPEEAMGQYISLVQELHNK